MTWTVPPKSSTQLPNVSCRRICQAASNTKDRNACVTTLSTAPLVVHGGWLPRSNLELAGGPFMKPKAEQLRYYSIYNNYQDSRCVAAQPVRPFVNPNRHWRPLIAHGEQRLRPCFQACVLS